jgi:ABC-type Mn2+/Zn2+ transport system ATPase subunit
VSPGETLLRASELELGYGAAPILRGVELEVRAGELWFLIGPNGTGKTTLLRAVLGTLAPRAGRLELHPELASRQRIGYVPQHCQLNPTLPTTVREFARLGFAGSAVPRRERAATLAWALEQVGLAGRERAGYGALSGGQRQRALVARALVRRPRLLIVDEPTEGLDVAAADAFRRTVLELNAREGLTLLFVTHNLNLAARIATHVALFDRGRVLAGPAAGLLRHDVIERVFGIAVELAEGAK